MKRSRRKAVPLDVWDLCCEALRRNCERQGLRYRPPCGCFSYMQGDVAVLCRVKDRILALMHPLFIAQKQWKRSRARFFLWEVSRFKVHPQGPVKLVEHWKRFAED